MMSLQKDSGFVEDEDRRRSVRKWMGRGLLALVPLGSLGLLSPVPSAVLAVRQRRRADWVAFGSFMVMWLLWLMTLAESPDGGKGLAFAASFALLVLNTVGAALHALLAGSGRARGEG